MPRIHYALAPNLDTDAGSRIHVILNLDSSGLFSGKCGESCMMHDTSGTGTVTRLRRTRSAYSVDIIVKDN